jgi:hypothetical protein
MARRNEARRAEMRRLIEEQGTSGKRSRKAGGSLEHAVVL